MSNRADDLETQVAELQAAVDGLTEELVETKERVRQLEATTDDLEADAGESAVSASAVESRTTAEEQAKARGTDERRDAEFVANRDADEPAETEEPPEEAAADGEDDSDDDGDDIIVA